MLFRRPRQIWIAYLLILAVLLPGFAWLTVRVVDVEYQERYSRARAEVEEKVSLALWRMETVAMPIIAAEAARPHWVYQPFQRVPSPTGVERLPSPLLQQPSEYVLLNFQLAPNGEFVSPQCPTLEDQPWACASGATPISIQLSCPRMDELRSHLAADELLAMLPKGEAATETQPSLADAATEGPAAGPGAEPGLGVLAGAPTSDPSQQQQRGGRGAYEAPFVQNTNAAQTSLPDGVTPQSDYANRSSKLQTLASLAAQEQRLNKEVAGLVSPAREGVSRPLWVDGRLLLARRVEQNGGELVQGCWLDWSRLQADLRAEVVDLLPEATLKPVPAQQSAAPGRTLASLPVELVAPAVAVPRLAGTPTQWALVFAWVGLLAACGALAFLLHGVASLSERRAAFVSAVTHELRTPLTTFQLYTEMLTGGMVRDEQQRGEYLDTLHREAGRLGHLVANVLAYSRLEHRPHSHSAERLTATALLERAAGRLQSRADLAARPLQCSISESAREVQVAVDSNLVEQILLNLLDNACKYGRNEQQPTMELVVDRAGDRLLLQLRDHGPGLTTEAQRRLFRPFSKSDVDAARTAPGLGLGLALSRDLARSVGGDLRYVSASGNGATFVLELPVSPA